MRDQAAIVGIGQTELSRNSGRTELRLACEAILLALADAGLDVKDVDGFVRYSNDSTNEIALVSALGLENVRFFGEVGYGGSAHCAVIGHGALAVTSGLADVVVCFRALNGASGHPPAAAATVGGIQAFTDPFGMLLPMDRLALFVRRYMVEFGITSEHFGNVAVSIREHAQHNPRAMLQRKSLSLAEHQKSQMVCDPLRFADCCLQTDGGAAVVIVTAERAKSLRQRPAYIMGFGQATGPDPNGIVFRPRISVSEATFAARDAYRMAGVDASDIDVAQFYDHFTPFVLLALEAYGFCSWGEGGPFVADGNIRWPGGRIPVNTHGGSLGEGYLYGFNHVLEAVRQVRGVSTCQVPNAEIALVGSAVAQVASALILRR